MKNVILKWLLGEAAVKGLTYAKAVCDVVIDALEGVVDGSNELDVFDESLKRAINALTALSSFLSQLSLMLGLNPAGVEAAKRLMDPDEISARLVELNGKIGE